jgi:L-seryl-tRNA(Ser) seleniumtransferase
LRLLFDSTQAHAEETAKARDVIEELGVRSFINAAGTFTALTGSLMRPEAVAAMQVASKKFVRLEDLRDAVGKRIAELLHCPAALVTAGCASALSLGTAACITGDDRGRVRRLPDLTGMKNEVLVQRTHRVNYDHAIRNTGVKMIEVEDASALESAINDRTAMMFFLNSADTQGKVHHEEFIAIARKHGIPTLIDAAADVPPVENLWRYTKLGFDLVAFSGGKGLRGPQSAGLLLGRADLIEAAKLNFGPEGDSLCRTNKVNKEESRSRRHLERLGRPLPLHFGGTERFRRRPHRNVRPTDRQRCSPPENPLGPPEAQADSRRAGAKTARRQAEHRSHSRLPPAVRDRRLDDGAR